MSSWHAEYFEPKETEGPQKQISLWFQLILLSSWKWFMETRIPSFPKWFHLQSQPENLEESLSPFSLEDLHSRGIRLNPEGEGILHGVGSGKQESEHKHIGPAGFSHPISYYWIIYFCSTSSVHSCVLVKNIKMDCFPGFLRLHFWRFPCHVKLWPNEYIMFCFDLSVVLGVLVMIVTLASYLASNLEQRDRLSWSCFRQC